MEEILVGIKEKKIVDRGFLIGPVCPIYGCGAILITIVLAKYHSDIPVLFILATVLGACLEYFTSYMMEKIFKVRWWDYSHDKYNLNGRICLKASLGFGALGVLMVHFTNPFFISLINKIPHTIQSFIVVILAILIIIDFIISFNVVSKIKKVGLTGAKDATDEITARVRNALKNKSVLTKRLINAFPNLKIKIKKEVKKVETEIQKLEKNAK